MKLHINKSLRAALMACYAVVASFTTTVTAGTLATGVITYSLLAEDAQAAPITITGVDGQQVNPRNGTATDEGDYIIANFTGGWFGGGAFGWTTNELYVQNWRQSGGSASERIEVYGDLTDIKYFDDYDATEHAGTGDIEFAVAQTMDHIHVFDGEHSKFSGDIIMSVTATNFGKAFAFTNSGADGVDLDDVAGTGAIQFGVRAASDDYAANVKAHDVLFFYSGNVSIGNSVIIADALSLNGLNTTEYTRISNTGAEASNAFKASRTDNDADNGATYTVRSILTLNTLEINDGGTAILTAAGSTVNAVTYGGGGTLQIGGGGSLTLVNSFALGDGNISINSGGTLIVGQALALAGVFQNDGTLSFAADATLDLTGATLVVENGVHKYDIFEGTGTIDVTNLTSDSIFGVRGISDSSVISFEDGMLTITGISSNLLTYAGGADPDAPTPIDWNAANIFDAGSVTFSNGDSVSFSGHTAANLTANTTVDELTVSANSSLSISSTGGFTLGFSFGMSLGAGSVLNIDHALMNNTVAVSANGVAGSSLFFAGEAAKAITLSSFLSLTNYAGELGFSNATVSVTAAGELGAVSILTLRDGATLSSGGLTLGRRLHIDGDATITATAGLTAFGEITGEGGSLTINGSSTMTSNVGFMGDIIIASGTTTYGANQTSTNTFAASSLTIQSGAQFTVTHATIDLSATDVYMNGGTLHGLDMDNGTGITYGKLTVQGTNSITHLWNGRFNFGELTSSGDAAVLNYSAGGEVNKLYINGVTNYNGTVALTAGAADDSILFGGVISQDAGNHMVVTTATDARLEVHEGAQFTGAGSVSFNSNVWLWNATLVDSTLNLTSYQFGSNASQMVALGGNLNLNGATFDSAVEALFQLGATTVGSTQNTVTWADALQLGAFGTGTAGTVDTPIYTTINTTKVTGSGAVGMVISGSISDVSESVGALKIVGEGTVTLSGNSSFTGGLVIENASVTLASATAAGRGEIDMSSGSLNVGGSAIRNTIKYDGGTLSGLSTFAGMLHVNTDLSLTDGLSGTVNVKADTSLTMGGVWTYSSVIENAGTVNLAADLTMDLSKATFTRIADGEYSLTLINGGTIVATDWLTGEGGTLDVSKLTGLVTDGRSYSYENGKLSYVLTAPFRVWNTNDALNWDIGTEFDGEAFAENDNVTFAAGIDTGVTLEAAIKANVINIEQDAIVSFADTEFALTVNEIYMSENSTLLAGDEISASLIAMAAGSHLSIATIDDDLTISMQGDARTTYTTALEAGAVSLDNIVGGDESHLHLSLAAEGTSLSTPLFTGNLHIMEGELILASAVMDFNAVNLMGTSSVNISQALVGGLNDLTGITGTAESTMTIAAAGVGSQVTLSSEFLGGIKLTAGSLTVNGSDFGGASSFTFNNGAGLVANAVVAEGNPVVTSTFSHDIEIVPEADGTSLLYLNASLGNELVLTGNITGDDNSSLVVVSPNAAVTLRGGDMTDFTGILSVRDVGSNSKLIVDTDMLNLQKISVWNGNTLEVAAGHHVTTNANDADSTYYQYLANHSYNLIIGENAVLTDNVYLRLGNGTINVSGGGIYIIDGFMGKDGGAGRKSDLNIAADTTVISLGTLTSGDSNLRPSFMLGHWGGDNATTVNINGTLEIYSGLSNKDGTGVVNVNDGGLFIMREGLYGVDAIPTANCMTLNVLDGGTLRLATQGGDSISAANFVVNFAGGSNIIADAFAEEGGAPPADEVVNVMHGVSLSGAATGEPPVAKTVTMSAESYVTEFNFSGAIINATDNASTLTLATKAGQTFTFSGANTYTTDTILTGEGTVRAGSATAFGTGTVVVGADTNLDLGSQALNNAITATDASISGMGAYQGTLTAIGTVNVAGVFGGNAVITAGNTLNISEKWLVGGTIKVAGALNLAADSLLDLGAATFTEDAGIFSTQLFDNTGAGTVDLGNLLDVDSKVDLTKITGAVVFGREYSISDTGVLSYIITASDLTWSSTDPLTWSEGTTFSEGGDFVQGDNVSFSEGTTVTLGENIQSAIVTVSADKTVSVSAGNMLEIGQVNLGANAALDILADSSALSAVMAEGSSLTIGSIGQTATLAAGAHLTLTESFAVGMVSLEGFTGSTATTQLSLTFADDPTPSTVTLGSYIGILDVQGGYFHTSWGEMNTFARIILNDGAIHRLTGANDTAFGTTVDILKTTAMEGSVIRLKLNADYANGTNLILGDNVGNINGDLYIESGYLNLVNITVNQGLETPNTVADIKKITLADGSGLAMAESASSRNLKADIHIEDGASVIFRHWGGAGTVDIYEGALTGAADTVISQTDWGAVQYNNMVDFKGTLIMSYEVNPSVIHINSSITELTALLAHANGGTTTGGTINISATAEADAATPIIVNTGRFATDAGLGFTLNVGARSFLNVTGNITSIDPAETASFVLANTVNVNGTLNIASGVTSLGAAAGLISVNNGGTLVLQQGLYSVSDQGSVNITAASGSTVKLHNQTILSSREIEGSDHTVARFAAGSTIIAMDETTDVLNTLELTGSETVALNAEAAVKNVHLQGVISGTAGLDITGTADQTFHLHAENTYTGETRLAGGANLIVGSANALATSVLNVTEGHADLAAARDMAGLSLTDLSSINVAYGANAAVLDSLTLSLTGEERVSLTLEGAPVLSGIYSEALFTGLTAENALTGIVFDAEGFAEADLYFEGLKGRLHFSNGVLSLVNDAIDKLVWNGGDGNFSDTNWTANGDTMDLFAGADIEFTAPVPAATTNMTVDMEASVGRMTVTGTGADYVFSAGVDGSLVIDYALTVKDGATATFNFAPSIAAAAIVTVAENSALHLNADASYNFASLYLVGTLETAGSITLSTETNSAGSLTAKALTLTEGTNSFGTLDIEGALNLASGALSVTTEATLGSYVGGAGLSIADSATLMIGTAGEYAATTASIGELTIAATATATIYGAASITDLNAAGTTHILGDVTLGEVSAAADLTIGRIAVQGGDPEVTANLTITTDKASTFGELTVTGDLTANGALDFTGSTYIGQSLTAVDNTVTFGDQTTVGGKLTAASVEVLADSSVGSIENGATLDINNSATFTIKSDTTIAGITTSATGGTLDVEGDLTVSSATNSANHAIIADGAVSLVGDNTLQSITAGGRIESSDNTQPLSLSVAADSSAETVAHGAHLEVRDAAATFSLTGTIDTDTLLGSFTGAGSLSKVDKGTLVLQSASSGKNITMGGKELRLRGNLALTGDLTTGAGVLNLTLDYDIERANASIKANTLSGATGLVLNIGIDSLDGLLLGNGGTYNFTELTTDLSNTFTLAFATAEGVTGNTWESGSKIYTLGIENGEIQLHLELIGNTWVSTSGTWDNNTANWETGLLPNADTSAFFLGDGVRDVAIAGNKTAKEVLVTGDYNFSGAAINAELLTITSGTLALSNSIDVSETTSIGDGATLHIQGSGSVFTTELNLTQGGALTIDENASMSIGNAVSDYTETNTSQGTLTNNGTLRLYGLAEEGTPNPADEIIKYDIASLDGTGALNLWSGTDLVVDTLKQGNLSMSLGAQLTVENSAVITDKVMSQGNIVAKSLELQAAGSVISSLDTEKLILNAGGTQITTLNVDEIQFANGMLVAGADALLTVDQMQKLNAGDNITLNLSGQMKNMGMGSYKIMSSTGTELNWSNMTMDADTMKDINGLVKDGMDVVYSKSGNTLSFVITEATDRRWFLSNNYAASTGMTPSDIPDSTINPMVDNETANSGRLIDAGLLNTVSRVYVDVEYSLDLSSANGVAVLRDLTGDADKVLTLTDGDAKLANTAQTWVEGLSLDNVNLDVALEAGSTTGHSSMASLVASDSSITVDTAARLTVEDMTLTDSTLTVGEGLGAMGQGARVVINNLTLNGNSATDVLASAQTTRAADSPVNLEIKETLTLNDTANHHTGEGAKTVANEVIANDSSSITAGNNGYSAIGTATLADNASVSTTGTGIVEIDKLESSVASNTMEGHIILGEGDYLGSYSGSTVLETKAKGETTLSTGSRVEIVGNEGSSITLVDRGSDNSVAGINTQGSNVYVTNNGLTVRESSTMVDSNLHFTVDQDEISNQMKTGTTVDLLGSGSQLTMQNSKVVISQSDDSVTLLDFSGIDLTKNYTIYDINIDGLDASDIIFDGPALSKYFSGVVLDSTGQSLILVFNKEGYASKASSYNGKAGSAILSPMIFTDMQTAQKDTDLAKVLNTLDQIVGEQADKVAAAAAGSSVTALGGAALASIDRQLQNVRNRVMGVGGKSMDYYMDGPVVSAWIAGEGEFRQLGEMGTAAGYDYNSFGGSFGVDVELDENISLGLTLTALYGSLDATGADMASGDFNNCNISFYAAAKHGNWNHSFIATVGIIDATLDRTVDYLTGTYKTNGSTDGLGFGLMYEAGYSYVLDKEETMTLQPIFNLAIVNATLNGYTETGSNAALEVGDQSNTYISLGLGTRFECLIGENAFNRSANFHARALVKFDAGDRYTDADVSIAGYSATGNVKGSEPGAVGLELGAGLNIPIGYESGALFIDAGVELREEENTVNATMGYRFNF